MLETADWDWDWYKSGTNRGCKKRYAIPSVIPNMKWLAANNNGSVESDIFGQIRSLFLGKQLLILLPEYYSREGGCCVCAVSASYYTARLITDDPPSLRLLAIRSCPPCKEAGRSFAPK